MKRYFRKTNEEFCFPLDVIKDKMKFEGIKQETVNEAQIERGVDYFFCQATYEAGEKGNCGNSCPYYDPRNGKSGNCKHNSPCYIPTEKQLLVKI
jgi:hypothetical protein